MRLTKSILTLILVIYSFTSFAQGSGLSFKHLDSTRLVGFGIGIEAYGTHNEFSKALAFQRKPFDQHQLGFGLYLSYFNFKKERKFNYHIDGGILLWHQNVPDEQLGGFDRFDFKFTQQSEVLQFTGIYDIGSFGLLARAGILYNHKPRIKTTANEDIEGFKPTYGLGVGIPLPFIKARKVRLVFMVSRINDQYSWSGTMVFPILFKN